jgi:hypothetical protein
MENGRCGVGKRVPWCVELIMRFNYFLPKLLIVIVPPCILFAQTCLNVSGQTVAFTLSPGSKATWNTSNAGVAQVEAGVKQQISFSVYRLPAGTIAFSIRKINSAKPVAVAFYSVDGRQMGKVALLNRTNGEFHKKLSPGIYFARLDINGVNVKTARFLVGR